MTSSNGKCFRVTGHLCGEFTGPPPPPPPPPPPGEFPTQRPVTRSFDVYFDLRPDKRLSKQWWGWWFETLSHSLWRHRNALTMWWHGDNINRNKFCNHRLCNDDVIKWKHFPRYWPFVRGIHRSPVNSPHKGQWRGALMFSLICVWINGWVNNREVGDLRRHRGHYDVNVMHGNPDLDLWHHRQMDLRRIGRPGTTLLIWSNSIMMFD